MSEAEKPTLLDEDASIQTEEVADVLKTEGDIFTDDTQDESQGTEDEAGDQEASADQEGDAAQDQGQQIALDDIAAALGLESDDLDVNEAGQVVLKTKIDGKESTVTFADSKRSYQVQGNLDNKAREANQLKESLQQQLHEYQQQHQAKLQQLEDVSRLALEDLQAEYSKIDWEALKQEDKGEYAARRADMQEHHNRIVSRIQAIQQERQTQAQQQQVAYIEKAEAALVEAFPEWVDVERGRKEMDELRQFGVELGFSQAQMQRLAEAPAFKALKMAKQFADLQKSKPEVKKLVRSAPKVSKPTGKTTPKRLLSAEETLYGT